VLPNIDREFDKELAKGIDRYEGMTLPTGVKDAGRMHPLMLNIDGFGWQ
jgi:hypothetical protein